MQPGVFLRRVLLVLVVVNTVLVGTLTLFAVKFSLQVTSLNEVDEQIRARNPGVRRMTADEHDLEQLRTKTFKALDMADSSWTSMVSVMQSVRSALVAMVAASFGLLMISGYALYCARFPQDRV